MELTAEVELLKERNKSFDERVEKRCCRLKSFILHSQVIELEKTVSSIDRALEQEKVQRNADNTENELRIENLRATLYQKVSVNCSVKEFSRPLIKMMNLTGDRLPRIDGSSHSS